MPYSDIDICSNALVLLGMEPITSLTEGTPSADVCGVRYPLLRDSIFSEYPWNFALKKALLSREVDTPVSGYAYQYLLPSDGKADGVIAAFETDDEGAHPISNYIIQGGRLLTDYKTVYADYIAEVDETYWPSYFVNFVAHALAADIALTLTRDNGILDRMELKAYGLPSDGGMGGLLANARRKDAYHSPPNNKFSRFPLIEARRASNRWKISS
jgi:hypothetical protein